MDNIYMIRSILISNINVASYIINIFITT